MKMGGAAVITDGARKLFGFMPEVCWMTAAHLAKGIKVRKAVISSLLDELEAARLIDIFFYDHGNYVNPRRLIIKTKPNKPRQPTSQLNAIYIGFPYEPPDRNSVIEIYIKRKQPIVPFEPLGKRPVEDLSSWQRLSDEEKLDYFINNPALNVGLRLPNNLCVIDVDRKDHPWSDLPAFERTLTVSTARGYHYYFASDAVVSLTSAGILPHTDTRCHGSFVVIPPSIHKSGMSYRWTNITKVQQLPLEFRREWRKAYFTSSKAKNSFQLYDVIPKGWRNDTLWRYGRSLRARGCGYDEIEAKLRCANAKRCSPNLTHGELSKLMKHVWRHPNRNGWKRAAFIWRDQK